MRGEGRLMLLLIAVAIALLAIALLLLWVPLPHPFPAPWARGRNLPAAALVGALGLLFVIGLAVWAVGENLKPGRVLDGQMASRGYSAGGWMVFGRRYEGRRRGRRVEVECFPDRSGAPGLVQVFVPAAGCRRMALGRERPLLDCRGCPEVGAQDLVSGELVVLSEDAAWARGALAAPGSAERLARLLLGQEPPGFRELYVQRDRLWFRCHPRRVSGDFIGSAAEDLVALAEACEGVARGR